MGFWVRSPNVRFGYVRICFSVSYLHHLSGKKITYIYIYISLINIMPHSSWNLYHHPRIRSTSTTVVRFSPFTCSTPEGSLVHRPPTPPWDHCRFSHGKKRRKRRTKLMEKQKTEPSDRVWCVGEEGWVLNLLNHAKSTLMLLSSIDSW